MLSLAAVVSCGPNYRYVYDGDSAFERCYGLDYDQSAEPQVRQQCWATWLQSYSFGAGADRVEYARNRANGTPTSPSQPMATPVSNDSTPFQTSAPQTSVQQPAMEAHTAPANVAVPQGQVAAAWQRQQISEGGNPIAAPPPTAVQTVSHNDAPGAACGNDCHHTWNTCGTACPGSAAACVARCDDGYRECMRGCF
jgi:hypothetical protein